MSQLFAWGGQKYWSFSFSIIPSKEIPGLISFRMDWLDLLAVHYSPSKKIQEEREHTTPLDKKVVLIQEAHGEWNKYLATFRKQNLPFLENTTFHGQV